MSRLSGRALSKERRAFLKEQVEKWKEATNITPKLVVILVGNNPASLSYVTGKKKASEEVGMTAEIMHLDATVSEKDLLDLVDKVNHDDMVHGLLVQLPLPNHINEQSVINAIALSKDVDGFHPLNIAALQLGTEGIVSATPKGIMSLIDKTGIEIKGKHAVVVGRSNIVGKPVAQLLLSRHATVTIAHSRTEDLGAITRQADILVVAVGRAHLIDETMIKEGAVVIDVGVNRVDGKLVGDVTYETALKKASFITPVPGGVGPMTITSLLENTFETYKRLVS
jgi:methylenetetrahydrofolate dehydrogenase (NADP+)/methenyltetrahydrofolate cyclohydrolase